MRAVASELETVGGGKYIAEMVGGVPRGTNVRAYAEIIKDKAERRLVIEAAHGAVQAGCEGDDEALSIHLLSAARPEYAGTRRHPELLSRLGLAHTQGLQVLLQRCPVRHGCFPVASIPRGAPSADRRGSRDALGDTSL
jgi:hypothetical protein